MNGWSLLVIMKVFLCLSWVTSSSSSQNLIWKWKCNNYDKESCTRLPISQTHQTETFYPSLETCRLVCGPHGALWPLPQNHTRTSNELSSFSSSSLDFVLPSGIADLLKDVVDIFKSSLSVEDTSKCSRSDVDVVQVAVDVVSDEVNLSWSTSEKYRLEITKLKRQVNVKISADTIFGVRHALETLSQLVEFYANDDGSTCLVVTNDVRIADWPTYRHRGLLLDTARNFLSVANIKKHLDGMGASKLNVLHWHVTDSQSFPLELPTLPNMTRYGAYSDSKIYSPKDVADILHYAKLRGVKVLVEVDAPAHAGNGWQWGPEAGLGNLAVCVNRGPYKSYCIEPPCGQLNPANPKLYEVLRVLYSDIFALFPETEVFHMGGDEVYIACWNSTQEIIDYIGKKARTTDTFLDLWAEYQRKALGSFDAAVGNTDTPVIVWSSHLTTAEVVEKYLPKERYVVQTWVPSDDPQPDQLLELGYRIIVSTKDAWYLDHGFWGNSQYHNWQVVYNNKIPAAEKTLGGEVCMWGEYVDDASTESRVWPRAAAAAERLWTDPLSTSQQAQSRFYRHRERLISKGINAEAVIPRWCYQNEGNC